MRAMAVTAYDEPLSMLDLPTPQIPEGFALLDVAACGVCYSDVKTARGMMHYSADLALPHVPGHEIAGRVLETNPPGAMPEGTLVVVYHYWPCGRCAACRRGDETLCSQLRGWAGFTHPGGFQERLAVPLDRLIAVPDTVDPVLAAPMSCAMGTAYRSVVTRGGVRAGSRVGVIGLGGVGIHAAQVARSAGGRVFGLDVHPPTLQRAIELGIDARRSDEEGIVQAMFDETDGEGLDIVVETVGRDDTLRLAVELLRPGGRLVGVGYSPTSALTVTTPRLVLGELDLVGSRFAHRDDMENAVRLVAAGAVQPVIGLIAPLDDVNDVFEALERGDVVGRAVLDIAGGRADGSAAGA